MIEKDKIKELVKSYLPHSENTVIESITQDIIRDVESVIYSMVRQAIAQERENIYRRNNKD